MSRRPKLKPRGYGDGSLRWDDDRECFELQHRVDGRRFVERGMTPKECETKRDERRAAALVATPVGASMSLADLFDRWLVVASSGKSPTTRRSYAWGVEQWARVLDVEQSIDRLTVDVIERAFVRFVDDGFAKWSIVKLRSHLKMALDLAVRNGWLTTSPERAAVTPKGGVRTERTAHFDEAEAGRVADYLSEHHSTQHAALLTVLLCGLRPGEALGLRWEHVRLADGELDVRSTLQRGGGNGVPERVVDELKTDHTGSDAARRTVPVPPRLARVLRQERDDQLARSGRSDYVFADAAGRHLSSWSLRGTADVVSKRTGAKRVVSPNGYRHTFGSLLWHRGVPAALVAKLMGHVDASMLTKVYGHPMVDSVDTAAIFGAMAQ